MSLKCVLQDINGILQDFLVLLPNCGFFLMKEEANDKSEPLPEWPGLAFDIKQIYGFDLGVFGPRNSPAAADTNSVAMSKQRLQNRGIA